MTSKRVEGRSRKVRGHGLSKSYKEYRSSRGPVFGVPVTRLGGMVRGQVKGGGSARVQAPAGCSIQKLYRTEGKAR